MLERKPSKKSKKVDERVYEEFIQDTSLKIKEEISVDLQKLIHDWNTWERDRKW